MGDVRQLRETVTVAVRAEASAATDEMVEELLQVGNHKTEQKDNRNLELFGLER